MKRAGEWHSIDLNENLVDGMLDGTVSRFVILHQEICSSDLSEIEVYGTIFSRFFWNQNWSCSSWYGSWLGRICHLFTGFQAIRASCDVTIQSISMHVFYHWEDVDLHCFQGTERNANRRQNARHKLKDCAMTYVRWICWNLHEGIIYWVSAACKGKAFVVFHWLFIHSWYVIGNLVDHSRNFSAASWRRITMTLQDSLVQGCSSEWR